LPLTPEDIAARVLHLDADVLVIDKPAGLPVHAGTKVQQHLEELLDLVRFGAAEPPRLAHRLDKDTSGCLVLGRTPGALTALGRLFAGGRVEKVYWAVTLGVPARPRGRIDLPLLKVAGPTGAMAEVRPEGKPAVTEYEVLGTATGPAGEVAWLGLRPRTGRTHQLRAHCRALGTPILGDPIYGPERPPPCPLHLHARAVSLALGPGTAPLSVEAPLPAHMAATFAAAGWEAGQGRDEVPV
jgi:RluA family pseudouridine synthase